jgi:Protein of unknown function (DUF3089)
VSRSSRLLLLVAGLVVAALLAPGGAAAKTVWLCKPGLKSNPCTPGLKTTYFSPTAKKLRVGKPRAVKHPKVDCFYVYPTVSDQPTRFANKRIDPELRSIALYQAARYTQHCRVYAPVYRQGTLAGLLGGGDDDGSLDPNTPYNDIREAWRTYLRKYNKGRGVILVSHSQGTFVLRRLVADEIDKKPKIRRKLVSAILLGGNVVVKKGKDVGGDFKHVRACRDKRQTGCVVAFSTFNAPVPEGAVFGRTGAAGLEVLCTNPAALGGGSATITPISPSAPFAPGTTIAAAISITGVKLPSAATPWVEIPNAYTARCSSAGGADVLHIDPRKGAPVYRASPTPEWGLHLVDANIALGDLVALVKSQIAAYESRD